MVSLSYLSINESEFIIGGRYFVTSGTGDLYIRSIKLDDNLKKFACQTTNKISREQKMSEPVLLSVKGMLLLSIRKKRL